MKKLIVVLSTVLVATTGMAFDYGNTVHWTGTGDWTNLSQWAETPGNGADWARPGWVVGNPYNTSGSAADNWNKGAANIDSGTVNVIPGSNPDGLVDIIHMGTDVSANSTLNISSDLRTRIVYMGYNSTSATDVNTINIQSGGNFLITSEAYLGRHAATDVINLQSGGTFETQGDKTYFGSWEGANVTFNINGGHYTNNGTHATTSLVLANNAAHNVAVNLSAGSFIANNPETFLGDSGSAVFTQTGGTAYFDRLNFAKDASASAVYSISGGTLEVSGYMTGPSDNGVFEVDGSGATSISLRALYFANGDTFRVKLDENGSTLVMITLTNVVNSFQLNNGSTFEVDDLAGFDDTVGTVYDIAYSEGGFMTDGMNFVNSTAAELQWDVVASGAGEMLQVTVIPEPATLGMIAFMGGALLWIRRKFMV